MIQNCYNKYAIVLYIIFVATIAYTQINSEPLEIKHQNAGIGCANCHDQNQAENTVKKEKCIECHGNYNSLIGTSSIHFYPMNSHWSIGPAECTDCHHMHHEQEMVCDRCHR